MDLIKNNMQPMDNQKTPVIRNTNAHEKISGNSTTPISTTDDKGTNNIQLPLTRDKLFDSFSDFATARTDNTRVAVQPRVEKKPSVTTSNFKLNPSDIKKNDGKVFIQPKGFNEAKADKTRVAIQPKPLKTEKKAEIPVPRQTYLSQAPQRDPVQEAIQRKQQKYREIQEKLQNNRNMICSMDPVAAQINGNHDFGVGGKPNWQKIGPNPLEGAGMIYATTNPVTSKILTGMAIGNAVNDPTPYNVASAGLAVLGTANLGGVVKAAGQTGQFMKTANTVNRFAKAEQAAIKISSVAENIDRVNTGASFFTPETGNK